jgi:hypothetical protein
MPRAAPVTMAVFPANEINGDSKFCCGCVPA